MRIDGELLRRSEYAIAHGALTNSKRPSCFVKGVYPTHLKKGKGAFVWDVNNKKYIDFIGALGTSILGYAHDEVDQAAIDQVRLGTVLSLGTRIEVETAEKVKECFPWVERVRFLKTGSEACNAALRIARAQSGYHPVYSDGYHGWSDEFTSLSAPALGVPKGGNITAGDMPPAGTAATIIEPVMTDISQERRKKLEIIRARCTETKTNLIFDEIITGFRTPKFGISNYFGIEPDLICLGKAIANGWALSVVAGKKDIMEGDYFVSSTFAGETPALAAAHKTMSLLQTKYKLDQLWEKGAEFLFKFNSYWPEGVTIEGYPTRGVFRGADLDKALFMQEACKSGILFGSSWFFNFSHIDLMDSVLATCKDILLRIRMGQVELEGEMPQKPYAQLVREQKRNS